ncbi:MAG: hypothetical protein RXO36_05515 [Candidatus Nanopusillus acidilobi]
MKLTKDKKQIETLTGLLIILGALIYLGLINLTKTNTTLQLSANTIAMGIIGIVIGIIVLVFAFKE